jgi:hypothetical protein
MRLVTQESPVAIDELRRPSRHFGDLVKGVVGPGRGIIIAC